MNKSVVVSNSFLSACIIVLVSVACMAAPQWHLIGLSGQRVISVYSDPGSPLLAGTDHGLRLLLGGSWYDEFGGLPSDLPVWDILGLANGDIVVAVGDGSKSDGIYLGRNILDGPPIFEFELIDYVLKPTALAGSGDTIYTGTSNAVYQCLSLDSLEPLKMQEWAFGVEMPVCADMLVFQDGTLYAGGFDSSPEPGPGNLVTLANDSMESIRQLNVTSLAQGNFFEVGPWELVIGTCDDGIYNYIPSATNNRWQHRDSPQNQPVTAIAAIPNLIWSYTLYVALPGGIYSVHGDTWTEIGAIPHPPTCFGAKSLLGGFELLAGTESGLYEYAEESTRANAEHVHDLQEGEDREIIPYKDQLLFGNKAGGVVEVKVFELTGKVLSNTSIHAGEKGLRRIPIGDTGTGSIGDGLRFIQLRTEKNMTVKHFVQFR
ncbi:MAG: hypothetical protein GF350_12285 [Chitinivibrionales bacterium]|nr:hypothetical protein [Chitinivibrionales bacterium]